MSYYQVVRRVAGMSENPGDFIAGDKYPNTLALARIGVLRQMVGTPPVVQAAAAKATEAPAAAAASDEAPEADDTDTDDTTSSTRRRGRR